MSETSQPFVFAGASEAEAVNEAVREILRNRVQQSTGSMVRRETTGRFHATRMAS